LHESNKGFEFNDNVIPRENEPIITKDVNSAFIGTDLKAQLKSLIDQEIPTATQKKIIKILPKDIGHVIYSSAPLRKDKKSTRQKAVLSVEQLINSAVLIESMPNRKGKAKPDIIGVHRFYVPVQIGNKIQTIRLVAQQSKKGFHLHKYDLYDVIIEDNKKEAAPPTDQNAALSGERASTLSIRQMLSNVKDGSGRRYFQGSKKGDARGALTLPSDGNPDYIISLFEGRDLSTALHEMGHFFLEVQRQVADDPDAPQELKDDWNKTLKWLGVEKGEDIARIHHEKFARGFETYLFEGKAPNIELREIFRRFKTWMTRIYRDVKNLNAPVSQEMSEVFSRMLATDDAIEAMSSIPTFRPDPNILYVLNKAEREKYIKNTEKVLEEAREKTLKTALKEIKKREGETWKREFTAEKERLLKDMRKQPSHRAMRYVRDGQYIDEKGIEIEGGIEDTKLPYHYLKDYFGDAVLKRIPKNMVSKDSNADPDIIADLFGFSSADQLVTRLINTEQNIERLAADIAEHNLLSRHGDIFINGTIEDEAFNNVYNDERTDLISNELAWVGKHLSEPIPKRDVFKSRAKGIIANLKIEKIRPNHYYYAEIRNAKEASLALGIRDYKKYAEYKSKQLLNHHLYRVARDTRADVDRALVRFNKYTKQPAKGKVKIDEEYRQKIIEITNKYNLGAKLSEGKRTRLEMSALAQWAQEKQKNEAAQLIIPQEIIDANTKTHYRDLTAEEFSALSDLLDNIATQGRLKNKITIDGKERDLDEVADKIEDTILNNVKLKKPPLQTRTQGEEVKFKVQNFFFNTIKARTFIREMDGFKDLGYVHEHLISQIDDAEALKAHRMRKVTDEVNDIFTEFYGVNLSGMASKRSSVHIPILHASIQKDGLLAMALNWGNLDNRTKLVDGLKETYERGLTEQNVQDILQENLSSKDWQFVQRVWTYIDSFWPEIESLERRRAGFAPEKVEGETFDIVTTDNEQVTIRGGYYPIKYDERLNSNVGAHEMEDIADLMRSGRFARAQTKRGHTEERVSSTGYPVRLDMGVLFQHLNQVVTDITMSEAIESTYKVLNHKNVKRTITAAMGKNVFDQLDMWLKDVAVGSVVTASAFDTIADSLRAGLSISVMGFKVSTTLIQLTGLSHTVVHLGAADTAKGLMKFLGGGNPMTINANAQYAFSKSKILQDRSLTFHRDIYDTMRIMQKSGQIRGKIAQYAFWPIVKMQMLVDLPTWFGAYQRGLITFDGDEAKAVRFADEKLVQAQSSGLLKDLSGFERGSISAQTRLSPMVRLWTSFYSYFNAKLNLAYEKTKQTDFKKPTDVARLATDYLLLFWIEAMLGELLLQRMPDFEEEDKSPFAWGAKLGLSQMAASLPVARELSAGLNGFDAVPAGLRGLSDVARAGQSIGGAIIDAFDEEEDVNILRVIRNVNSAGGILFKYPSAQMNQALKAIERSNNGEEIDPIDYVLNRPK